MLPKRGMLGPGQCACSGKAVEVSLEYVMVADANKLYPLNLLLSFQGQGNCLP